MEPLDLAPVFSHRRDVETLLTDPRVFLEVCTNRLHTDGILGTLDPFLDMIMIIPGSELAHHSSSLQ